MELQLKAAGNSTAGAVSVADSVFAGDVNEALVHQLVTSYLAGGRSGTKSQKTRSQVRGGGAKPWRQKGTGRARSGTNRSPIWVGGGVAFAAVPRDYSQKVNRKAYRVGMRSIFADLVASERLLVVESLSIDAPKTRELAAMLESLGVGGGALLLAAQPDEKLFLAARNIPCVEVRDAAGVDPVSLLQYEHVVITVDAVRQIEEWLQ